MPLEKSLTKDDIDQIGQAALQADQPMILAQVLIDAVEQDGLDDPAERGYALIQAAEITERQGDSSAALALAERSVAAYGDAPDGFAGAFRAELLHKAGRADEALAALDELRPLLQSDADAVSYISETLGTCGQTETAEQWLTEALRAVLKAREAGTDHEQRGQVVMMVHALAHERHRLRRELGLPRDEYDDLADRLQNALSDAGGRATGNATGPTGRALLFWPRDEFSAVLMRWPGLSGAYGSTWDEHRARAQRALETMAADGESGLALFAGSAEGLIGFLARRGGDPADPQVRADYAQQLTSRSRPTPWPPERNGPCWCGADAKYKKCCLPRARA